MKKIQEEMKDEIKRVIQDQKNMKKQKDDEISKMRDDIERMKMEYENKLKSLSDKFTEQLRSLSEQVESFKNKANENSSTSIHQFSSDSDTKGIISHLGDAVSISAGGKHNSRCPLTNIRKYDDSYFYNYYGYKPISESDSFIKFDFGSSMKVDLHSYLIRSVAGDPSFSDHPKTWRIEGSNDNTNWKRLDRRVNDPVLNGRLKQHLFTCQERIQENENRKFRYIRYVQEDSWYQIREPYYVSITYFELYGIVYYNQ